MKHSKKSSVRSFVDNTCNFGKCIKDLCINKLQQNDNLILQLLRFNTLCHFFFIKVLVLTCTYQFAYLRTVISTAEIDKLISPQVLGSLKTFFFWCPFLNFNPIFFYYPWSAGHGFKSHLGSSGVESICDLPNLSICMYTRMIPKKTAANFQR